MADRIVAKKALSDATRYNILKEATKIFARYGYRRASMDEIARAAGMSRQGLYTHFPSKETLFKASVEFGTEESCDMFASCLSESKLSLEDRLLNAFQIMVGNPAGLENFEEIINVARSLNVIIDLNGQLVGMIAAALDRTDIPLRWASLGLTTIDLAEHLVTVSNGIKKPISAQLYQKHMHMAIRMVCRGAAQETNEART